MPITTKSGRSQRPISISEPITVAPRSHLTLYFFYNILQSIETSILYDCHGGRRAELFATDTSAHSVMNTTCHHDAQNEKLTNPEPKYAPNSAALVNPPIGSSPEATPFRISIRTIANKRAAKPKPPVSSRISRTQLCGCEGRYSAFRCGMTVFAPAILLEASIP